MSEQDNFLFNNPPLDLNRLPAASDLSFSQLSPSYRRYIKVTTILTFVLLALPMSGVWVAVKPWVSALIGALWTFLFVGALLLTNFQYRIKGYALRAYDISYRSGLIFRQVITVPFSRIQHCEIQEGPLERFFGLNTLLVYTAGGSSSDLTIPGLSPGEAKRLRNFILQKVNGRDEEE